MKVDRFAAAIADAVARVRCGSNERPPLEPPLQALLNGLLEIVPERRKTVEELCHEEWFELMRGGPDQASPQINLRPLAALGGRKAAKHRARSKAQTLRGSSAALAAAAAPAPADAAKPPFVRKVTPPPDAILEAAPPPREGRVVSPTARGSLG